MNLYARIQSCCAASPHKVLGYPFGYRGGILEEGAERRFLKSETEQRFETVPTEIQGSDDTQGLSLRLNAFVATL